MVSLRQLLDKNIDGLLIEPSGGSEDFENSDNFKKLKALDIPVIFMDWMIDDADVSFITPNDFVGGFRATQYLIDVGHERIGFVGPFDKGAGVKRFQGYEKALKKNGIEPEENLIKLSSIVDWNKETTIPEMVRQLMAQREKKPTAIIFYNDDGAIKGYRAIKNEGYQIPDDVSVMSFDDSELATLTVPQLTSVIHPKYKLGVLGAEMLLEQLERQNNRGTYQIVINPGIAVRDSVKRNITPT
jgi:GntR family transcriptional regulator of arabinose operon